MRQTRIPNRHWRDMVEGNENHCARDPGFHSFHLSPFHFLCHLHQQIIDYYRVVFHGKIVAENFIFSLHEKHTKITRRIIRACVEKGTQSFMLATTNLNSSWQQHLNNVWIYSDGSKNIFLSPILWCRSFICLCLFIFMLFFSGSRAANIILEFCAIKIACESVKCLNVKFCSSFFLFEILFDLCNYLPKHRIGVRCVSLGIKRKAPRLTVKIYAKYGSSSFVIWTTATTTILGWKYRIFPSRYQVYYLDIHTLCLKRAHFLHGNFTRFAHHV